LRVMKRRWRDAHVYLFFNEGAKPSKHEVTLDSDGRKTEQWDPQTGTIRPLDSKHAAGSITFQLRLQPFQTSVVVVR